MCSLKETGIKIPSSSGTTVDFNAGSEESYSLYSDEAPPCQKETVTRDRARNSNLLFTDLSEIAGVLVRDSKFDTTIVFLITLNAIMLGVETYISQDSKALKYFSIIDMIFLAIFTLELILQFAYHGFNDFFRHPWLLFDLSVVFSTWIFRNMQIVRAFRIFRVLRLFGRVEGMKQILTSIQIVLPKIASISMIMILIFYIFGVMFTNLFRDLYSLGYGSSDYFGSLHKSFLTMFQLMSLDSWSIITRETMELYPWAWFPIVLHVTLTAYLVLNLIIAALVDSMVQCKSEENIAAAISGSSVFASDMDVLRAKVDLLLSQQQIILDAMKYKKVLQSNDANALE